MQVPRGAAVGPEPLRPERGAPLVRDSDDSDVM